MIFAWINFAILMAIALVHVFWALGGKWGASAAIPEVWGEKLFKPSTFSTLIVAFAVGMMAVFHLYKVGYFDFGLSGWLSKYGLWIISIIFLVRAIGDTKYVGFFKAVQDTHFAKLDTRFYSPLCIVISLNAFFTAIIGIL